MLSSSTMEKQKFRNTQKKKSNALELKILSFHIVERQQQMFIANDNNIPSQKSAKITNGDI